MIIANQAATRDAVIAHKADFGVAFDGDFDRCFCLMKTDDLLMAVMWLVCWQRHFYKNIPSRPSFMIHASFITLKMSSKDARYARS